MQRRRSWLSKHQDAQQGKANNLVGPQTIKIGGEANGEVEVGVDFVEDGQWAPVEGLLVVVDEVVLEAVLGQ